jgi:hypothetical protein
MALLHLDDVAGQDRYRGIHGIFLQSALAWMLDHDLPDAITLTPGSETLANLMPEAKGLEAGLVESEVVLADPRSKGVVAVIVEQ